MEREAFDFRGELIFLLRWSTLLAALAYLISIPVLGVTLSMALGLAAGLLSLALRQWLMYRSIQRAKDGAPAMRVMLGGYTLRLLIVAVVFWLSSLTSFVHPVGTLIPLLFPKLVYTAEAAFHRKKGGKQA